MKPLGIKGLMAAVVTPMDASGDLNLDLVPRIVEHLVENGIAGVYIAGSTGEGMSLTGEERRAVAESYVKAVGGRMRTVVQVGHNCIRSAAALAAHAERSGADAISATPTGYFQAEGEEGLVASMEPIVEAARSTPFYYYHIPRLSGAAMNPMRFTELAADRLPTFCGIKYSDPGTIHNLPLLQKAGAGMEFLSGSDEGYLQALALGYDGAVGSTYNYAARLYQRVRVAFEAGDWEEARHWQGRAMEMIEAMIETCGRASLKVMMGMIGIDCGPSRRPVEPASEAQISELRRKLESMGWFEWIGEEEAVAK